MDFCKVCENMLYIKINDATEDETEERQLVYYCKNCNETYDKTDDNNCVYHISYDLDNIKRENAVNKYSVNDPTLPKATGKKCPNKQCPAKKTNIVYIKSDDSNMKYIYICVACHNAGITPNTW